VASGRRIGSRQLLIAAAVAAALGLTSAVVALANAPDTEAAGRAWSGETPDHVTIRLREVGDSGVSGKATLRAGDDLTTVAIRLTADDGDYPAQIDEGTCDEFRALRGFPLADAVPGRTTRTLVEISLAELLAGAYVINVHKPAIDLETLLDPSSVVACGAIAAVAAPAGTTAGVTNPPVTGVGPPFPGDSFRVVSIGLALLAGAFTAAGIVVRRLECRPSSPVAV
jgi:hypothetical protein